MSKSITVFVDGDPKGQPRARAFARGGHARVYDPGTAEGWKSQVALAFRGLIPSSPLDGPLAVHLGFIFSRPKNHYRANGTLKESAPRYHTSKPDIDNLEKAVLDAMKQIGMFRDDAQVCKVQKSKRYVGYLEEGPGCWIEVYEA